MIVTKIIDESHQGDINIKNEPFALTGRMIPSYDGKSWSYSVERVPETEIGSMCFPNENYSFGEMKNDTTFIGAYDGDECIGLAVMQKAMFRYMYLLDLKVCTKYRRHGIGRTLIEAAKRLAAENNYRGIYACGQDNNLEACLFYIGTGFRIGGVDSAVYTGTSQEGKSDIFFYTECDG